MWSNLWSDSENQGRWSMEDCSKKGRCRRYFERSKYWKGRSVRWETLFSENFQTSVKCGRCFETMYLLKWAFSIQPCALSEKTRIMGEPELEVSTRAYCKMIMHSAKYPRLPTNIYEELLWSTVYDHPVLPSMVCSCPREIVWKLGPGKYQNFGKFECLLK